MKYLKFLIYYLKSKNVATDPSVDVLLKIIKELDNKSDKINIAKFEKHKISKKLYNEKQHLLDYIKTHKFKKDTFGYDLKKFWSNQSVDLLKEYASKVKHKNKDRKRFGDLFWIQHDIIHFLNGYNTTPLAEVAVLSFTLAQEKRSSFLLFILAGWFISMKHGFINAIRYPKICFEAYKRGKQSKWFMIIDWREHLNKKTTDVKKLVNLVNPPKLWNQYLREYMKLHKHLKERAA
mgnify:CR=1 FL=1|tara:strand:+ start:1012 stop:1716 length:705 start_codon:yes stop_codon:yes gene_type:complete